jgi:uncharacterized membrane protein
MNLETGKYLGGIGALLIVIAVIAAFGVPYAGFLGLVGLILVLISAKFLADHYGEGGIFNNALYALIMGIIGVIAFIGIAAYSVLSALAELGLDTEDWSTLPTIIQQRMMEGNMSFIWNLIGAIILAWVVLSICLIIATVFSRKSLNLLSAKTGVGLFGVAGILMLIGGILSVIFIGIILIWIAWILVAVAFFLIKTQPTQPSPPPQPAQPPP